MAETDGFISSGVKITANQINDLIKDIISYRDIRGMDSITISDTIQNSEIDHTSESLHSIADSTESMSYVYDFLEEGKIEGATVLKDFLNKVTLHRNDLASLLGCNGGCTYGCANNCDTGCGNSCADGCSGSCRGGCSGCSGGCSNQCSGCGNECGGGCGDSCTASCGGCEGSCDSWCGAWCNWVCVTGSFGCTGGTCERSCSGSCAGDCEGSCSGECTTGCRGSSSRSRSINLLSETETSSNNILQVTTLASRASKPSGCNNNCYTTCETSCYDECDNTCVNGASFSRTELHAEIQYCTNCSSTCLGTCDNTCSDGCFDTCLGTCTGTCFDGCAQSCSDACSEGCSGSCSAGCADGCLGTCIFSCEGGCAIDCSGDCMVDCLNTCNALESGSIGIWPPSKNDLSLNLNFSEYSTTSRNFSFIEDVDFYETAVKGTSIIYNYQDFGQIINPTEQSSATSTNEENSIIVIDSVTSQPVTGQLNNNSGLPLMVFKVIYDSYLSMVTTSQYKDPYNYYESPLYCWRPGSDVIEVQAGDTVNITQLSVPELILGNQTEDDSYYIVINNLNQFPLDAIFTCNVRGVESELTLEEIKTGYENISNSIGLVSINETVTVKVSSKWCLDSFITKTLIQLPTPSCSFSRYSSSQGRISINNYSSYPEGTKIIINGSQYSLASSIYINIGTSSTSVNVYATYDGKDFFISPSNTTSGTISSYVPPAPTVSTPRISFDSSTNMLTITCSTSGATIYYRVGTSGSYSTYSGPTKIHSDTSTSTYIYAYATRSGYNRSGTTSRNCQLSPCLPDLSLTMYKQYESDDNGVKGSVTIKNSMEFPKGTTYTVNMRNDDKSPGRILRSYTSTSNYITYSLTGSWTNSIGYGLYAEVIASLSGYVSSTGTVS